MTEQGQRLTAAEKRRKAAEKRRQRLLQNEGDRLRDITGERLAPGTLGITPSNQPNVEESERLEQLARPILSGPKCQNPSVNRSEVNQHPTSRPNAAGK